MKTLPKPTSQQPTPQEVVKWMYHLDVGVRSLGIVIKSIGVGRCRLQMQITDSMLNFHHTAHGGFLFLLADTAFAYASNSHNQVAVAYGCEITFLQPGHLGQTYVATAEEKTRQGRNGIYDITITDPKENIIAMFRGKARFLNQEIIPTLRQSKSPVTMSKKSHTKKRKTS